MKKKIIIILIIFTIWSVFFLTDFICVKNNHKPIFMIKIITYKDGGSREYYGLFYKVIDYNTLDGYDKMKMGTYFMKYQVPIPAITNFTIIDDTEVCAEALEEFFEDDKYTYFLPCIKSSNVFIDFGVFISGEPFVLPLKEALNKGLVTIDELKEKGFDFYQYEKEK